MDLLADAPEWLVAALAAPYAGLSAFLETGAPGVTGGADLALDVLLDWLDCLDDEIVAPFDHALAAWVEAQWGTWRPQDSTDAVLIAEAWQRVCDIAVQLDRAELLRAALRARASERMTYLGPLSRSPSLDPLGRYLAAIGTRQPDTSLAPIWWRIARLPEDVPTHHLRYALNGVRWLPPSDASARGRFRPELVDFLQLVAESLARVSGEGRLADERARRLFLQLGRRALSLYPKRQWWLPHVGRLQPARRAGEWIAELFPDAVRERRDGAASARQGSAPEGGRDIRETDEYDFMVRGQELRTRLEADVRTLRDIRAETLALADALLGEERRYAEQTGNAGPLAQSLCSLATPIRTIRPDLATAWAEEAVAWEPWSRYPWNILTRAVWSGEGPGKALPIAFRAVERVPHQPSTWHELGQVLLALNCVDQAQEIFEAEIERFGDMPLSLHSLGELHLRRGRILDARAFFERVLLVESGSWRGLTGLARTMTASGQAAQAAELLKPYLAEGSSTAARTVREEYARATRAQASTAAGARPETAQEDLRVVTADEPATFVSQARLLRRAAARRGDDSLARAAEGLLRLELDDPDVVVERSLIDVEFGELDVAESRAVAGLERSPGDLSLHYVRAHVAVRKVERDRPTFSHELMASVMSTLRPLRDLNSAVGPLVELQAARASLGMVDGEVVLREQRRRLGRVVDWQPREQGDERGWWEERVQQTIFAGSTPRSAAMVAEGTVLEARSQVPAASRFLDQLQEEFVSRVAAVA